MTDNQNIILDGWLVEVPLDRMEMPLMHQWSLLVCRDDLVRYAHLPWSRTDLSENPNLCLSMISDDIAGKHPNWTGLWQHAKLCKTHGFLVAMELFHREGLKSPFSSRWDRFWLSDIVTSVREIEEIDRHKRSFDSQTVGVDIMNLAKDDQIIKEEFLVNLVNYWLTGALSSRLPFSEIVAHRAWTWRAGDLLRNPGFIWKLLLLPDPKVVFPSLVGTWDWATATDLAPMDFITWKPDLPWHWDKIRTRTPERMGVDLARLCREKTSGEGSWFQKVIGCGLSLEELATFDPPIRIQRRWLSQNPKIPIAILVDQHGKPTACQRQVNGLEKIYGSLDYDALFRRATFDELPLLPTVKWRRCETIRKATVAGVYRLWDRYLSHRWGPLELVKVKGIQADDLRRLCGQRVAVKIPEITIPEGNVGSEAITDKTSHWTNIVVVTSNWC